jgi:hypothetical protein
MTSALAGVQYSIAGLHVIGVNNGRKPNSIA